VLPGIEIGGGVAGDTGLIHVAERLVLAVPVVDAAIEQDAASVSLDGLAGGVEPDLAGVERLGGERQGEED